MVSTPQADEPSNIGQLPNAVAKLVPPHADKHWSFQIVNRTEAHGDAVKRSMADADVASARPFIQGMSPTWLMVEFWTRDKALVDAAARQIAQRCGMTYSEGEFTRADVGL